MAIDLQLASSAAGAPTEGYVVDDRCRRNKLVVTLEQSFLEWRIAHLHHYMCVYEKRYEVYSAYILQVDHLDRSVKELWRLIIK